jgi:Na+/H+ antiporter NhaC
MKSRFNYSLAVFVVVLVAFSPLDFSAQCAMCKEAASSSLKANPTGMARSLNSGILYLMAVPYLMILFIFRKQVVQLWRHVFRKYSKNTVNEN